MSLRPIIALFVCLLTATTRALDVDSGMDAIRLEKALAGSQLSAFSPQLSLSGWVRLRGIDLNKVPETREALLKLRSSGIHTCVFLRRSVKDWKVTYLPADLSDAYEHGRKLGATYGDLVDAWEVDNEPDLGFVPESAERYTAFLKAMYLGLKAGSREQGAGSLNNPQVSGLRSQVSGRAPLVIMGSLGLPPGPWLERFAANDGFAYTDGFNYHYYGYAEDFTGVYRQHEAALRELGAWSLEIGDKSSGSETNRSDSPLRAPRATLKNLPVFMTEIGYGMLGKNERDTKEGRLRQWRWFKSVGEQVATLRPEAPMAFYVPPYLEYDTSEYGLTVSAKPSTGRPETGDRRPEIFSAGGIEYSPSDFGAEKAEPWMANIGKSLGGNEATPALTQWLAGRSAQASTNSRAWIVSVNGPSPVVIDFLPNVGLSHVKRYNGLFVTSREPPAPKKPETGEPRPEVPKPKTPELPRSEEFILQVRTQNGNLYEVYPTRQATPDWQRFMEPGDNFTMAFYGRAALPWRFKDNKPASLVIVMYPKSLPATYEFRRPQLIKLSAASSQLSANHKYGRGTVILYNFSDKPLNGRLSLPEYLTTEHTESKDSANSAPSVFKLLPNERREIPMSIKVPWDRYTRIEVPITFIPEDVTIPPARYLTALIPDVGGMPARLVTDLLSTDNRQLTTANRDFVATRPRAPEEAPMTKQSGWFAQSGATIDRTADGFTIAVAALPSGKPQRIEVEIPWPDGIDFPEDSFLSAEFRLAPGSEVSGLRSQVSGLRSQVSGLSPPNQ